MAWFRYIIFQIKKERTHTHKTTPTLADIQTNIYLSSLRKVRKKREVGYQLIVIFEI